MKRKNTLLSLVLTVALVLGAFTASFAAFNIGTATDGNEYKIEKAAFNLQTDAKEGKYKLVDTDKLAGWYKSGKEMLIIDTMPGPASYDKHHVPGAINAVCGDNGPNGEFTTDQQKALLAAVRDYSGVKKVKYFYNSTKKRWVTKKPAAKDFKGKKTKYVEKPVKDKLIVVYCGFTACKRSHAAAAYLVEKGYTKVYRYPGGISAWGDADPALPFEETDAEVQPEP